MTKNKLNFRKCLGTIEFSTSWPVTFTELENFLKIIPDNCKSKAIIESSIWEHYGSYTVELDLVLWTEETDEEHEARIKEEKRQQRELANAAKKAKEVEERRLYERLKAKFEKN